MLTTDSVYMIGEDPLFGRVLAVIYQTGNDDHPAPRTSTIGGAETENEPPKHRLSAVIVSKHGTSGFINMTVDQQSRFWAACQNLPEAHAKSLVRQALAIASLRSFATMDPAIKRHLMDRDVPEIRNWDETMAGTMASRFRLADGKYPDEIGQAMIDMGVMEPKYIKTNTVDVVYEDSDSTIEQNNELVYLLGDQLEQLFDPLSEYSPEPTEILYSPPTQSTETLEDNNSVVRSIAEELYILQANARSDLLGFLEEFLIPLRVKVLGGEVEDMTIQRLNTIFPPTIDEMFRINNIFYEALQQALPYGAFEVMRACGMTIPYFYKAAMRHEAATKSFQRNLKSFYPSIKPSLRPDVASVYTPRRIESIMHCSLHLTKLKLVLDRLVQEGKWTGTDGATVEECYHSAVGTIDAFGRESNLMPYDRRIFTPTGKILVEIASQWPKELEYGWMNRRVVTIFDGLDLLQVDKKKASIQTIVIMFTDAVVLLQPKERIPMVSASGYHRPSVADMLMHAMVNEVPVANVPDLHVVSWAQIADVHLAEFNDSRSLAIYATGNGFREVPQKGASATSRLADSQDERSYLKLFRLVRPDHQASKFVELAAKAKVTNKTQPFHLFKSTRPQLTLYATVHEAAHYDHETRRSPIAMFFNVDVTRTTLEKHNLAAAIAVEFVDQSRVRMSGFSRLGHEFSREIHKAAFPNAVVSELAYYYTLYLSSANTDIVSHIVASNTQMTQSLVEYALAPSDKVFGVQRKKSYTVGRRNTPVAGSGKRLHTPVVRPSSRAAMTPVFDAPGDKSASQAFAPPVPSFTLSPPGSDPIQQGTSVPPAMDPKSASTPSLSLVPRDEAPGDKRKAPRGELLSRLKSRKSPKVDGTEGQQSGFLSTTPDSQPAEREIASKTPALRSRISTTLKRMVSKKSPAMPQQDSALVGLLLADPQYTHANKQPTSTVRTEQHTQDPAAAEHLTDREALHMPAPVESDPDPSQFQFPRRTAGETEAPASSPPKVVRKKKSFTRLNNGHGNIASDDSAYVEWEDLSEGLSSVSISTTPSMANEEARQQRDVDEWYEGMQRHRNDGLSLSTSNDDDELESSFDPHEADDHAVHLTRFFHEDKRRSMFVHEKGKKHSRLSDDVYIHDDNPTPKPDDYNWIASTPLGSPEIARSAAVMPSGSTEVSALSHDLDYTFDSTPSLQHASYASGISGSRETTRMSVASSVDTILFEDDFAYLAGLLADEDTKTSGIQAINDADSLRLYPGLRDSSILFLGEYVHRSNESQSRLPVKAEVETPKHSRSNTTSYQAGHQTTDSEWTTTGTYSSSDPSPRRGHGLRQASITGVAYNGPDAIRHSGLFELSPVRGSGVSRSLEDSLHEMEYEDEQTPRIGNNHLHSFSELSRAYSAGLLRQGDTTMDSADMTQASLPVSASFKRMVGDASMNTLQLAGFIMQFDQLMATTPDPIAHSELERAKNISVQLYEHTRRIGANRNNLASFRDQIITGEGRARKLVASSVWTLMLLAQRDVAHAQKYDNIVRDLLDLEWLRRGRLYDAVDDLLAIQLWEL